MYSYIYSYTNLAITSGFFSTITAAMLFFFLGVSEAFFLSLSSFILTISSSLSAFTIFSASNSSLCCCMRIVDISHPLSRSDYYLYYVHTHRHTHINVHTRTHHTKKAHTHILYIPSPLLPPSTS